MASTSSLSADLEQFNVKDCRVKLNRLDVTRYLHEHREQGTSSESLSVEGAGEEVVGKRSKEVADKPTVNIFETFSKEKKKTTSENGTDVAVGNVQEPTDKGDAGGAVSASPEPTAKADSNGTAPESSDKADSNGGVVTAAESSDKADSNGAVVTAPEPGDKTSTEARRSKKTGSVNIKPKVEEAAGNETDLYERKRPKRECTTKRVSLADASDHDDEDYAVDDESDSDEENYGKKKRRGGSFKGVFKRAMASPSAKSSGDGAHGEDKKPVCCPAPPAVSSTTSSRGRGRPSSIYSSSVENTAAAPRPGGSAPTTSSTPAPTSTVTHVSRGRGSSAIYCEPPNSEMTPDLMAGVLLANNMNSRRELDLQTLYVKIDDATEGMNALLGWSVKDETNKLFFQCMFCPVVDNTAKGIAAHIKRAHQSMQFAMVKKVPPSTQLLFMHCRRCDYITVDTISIWIHYALHHGLSGILSLPGVADVSPQPTTRKILSAMDEAVIFPYYKCAMCEFLATDNRYVAQHAVQNHPAAGPADDYTGCFVRVLKVSKPKQPEAGDTYADIVKKMDAIVASGMQCETFVCVLCSYVSFCRYLAVSHHIRVHTGKFLMYKCSYDQCRERCATSDSMIQHLKSVHECGTVLYQRMCCQVTLVEKQGNALTESFSLN